MLTKLFVLLFTSTLLPQSSWGDAQSEKVNSSTDSSSSAPAESVYESNLGPLNTDVNGFFPNLRLLILIAQDFYPLIFTALGSGQQLFAEVNDALYEAEDPTGQLPKKLNDLKNFSAEIDKFSEVRDFHCYKYIEMLESLIHKLDSLNTTAMENPNHEDLLIDRALRQNGLKRMEQKFAHAFGAYLSVLSKQLETVEKLLPGKELALDKDVQDWIAEIKDMIRRIGSIVLFLEEQIADE